MKPYGQQNQKYLLVSSIQKTFARPVVEQWVMGGAVHSFARHIWSTLLQGSHPDSPGAHSLLGERSKNK